MPLSSLSHSPAAERNQAPILDTLRRLLPPHGHALELASGTGQHAAHFASALPGWRWQPSDLQATHFSDIAVRAAQAGVSHQVLPAVAIDVQSDDWPAAPEGASPARYDLLYCANMLHIAPWPCCAGLMRGAARALAPQGVLVTYGPYFEDGVPTAPGNLAFDATLRNNHPEWGIRHLNDVAREADNAGLQLQARHALPANNLLLVWGRKAVAPHGEMR